MFQNIQKSSSFDQVGTTICGLLQWILLPPLLLLLFVPILVFLSLWKCVVLVSIKFQYPSTHPSAPWLLEMTNSTDTTFCLSELSNVISYALLGDGIIDLQQFREHFYTTFVKDGNDLKYPIFHQTFTTILGYSYKIRASEPLDLTRHIREEELFPSEGKETENEAYLRIADDHARIRGAACPKWEIVLVQNRDEERSTMIIKISHGLVDAYSIRTLLDKLLMDKETTEYRIPDSAKPKSLLHGIKLFANIPLLGVKYWRNVKRASFGTHPFLKNKRIRSPSERIPKSKQFWSRATLEFSKIQEISKKSGCKISPICASLYTSTLKSFLSLRGKWEENGNQIASHTPLIYSIPAPAPHPADSGRFCNHHVPAFVNLPLKEVNALNQLKRIHEEFEAYEKLEFGWVYQLCQSSLGPLCPKFVTTALIKRFMDGTEPFVTLFHPFIFSPSGYRIQGVGVSSIFFLSSTEHPFGFRGAMFTPLTSPRNQLNFSVTGCQDLFENQEDADTFVELFLKEVEILRNEIASSTTKSAQLYL